MVLYWLLIYQILIATLDKVDKINADFLWGRKKLKISWLKKAIGFKGSKCFETVMEINIYTYNVGNMDETQILFTP